MRGSQHWAARQPLLLWVKYRQWSVSLRAGEPQETRLIARIKRVTSSADTSGLCPQPGETAAGTRAENVIHVTHAREPQGPLPSLAVYFLMWAGTDWRS